MLRKLTLNIEFDNKLTYRRLLLITSVLLITTLVLSFFALFNAFVLHDYLIASINSAAAIISIYALYNLKKYKNVPLAAKLSTFNLVFFFLTFILVNGNDHFGLIWTVFVPIYSILTNGKQIGVYFSLAFYTVLFILSFNAIGIWNDGAWQLQDWLRLSIASSVLTLAMYMNESAMEESDKQLVLVREREKEYIKKLEEKSITDELTGLYNRRYYNEMIPKLISLAKRKDYYITFFILDIDFFKDYNDHYGHQKGDETLIAISNVLRNHIQRGDDFVFRLGGEEFAGIIISEDKEKTYTWILSITKVIENLKIEHKASKISKYVTSSIGISTLSPDKNYNGNNLYRFADEALYIAKNSGRNRAELSIESA